MGEVIKISIRNEIRSYIVKAGWTLTAVVDELNKKRGTNYTVQNLSNKLRNETIRYKEVKDIAEIIGYELEWIENDSGQQ
jgi:transposase